MRRLLLVLLLCAAALTSPQAGALPTPGFASDNVEWLGNTPLQTDSAGARMVGGYLYVTSSSNLSIYDAKTDPAAPRLASVLPLPNMPYFAEEDVDTNGRILLIGTTGMLVVVDVSDKALPKVLSVLRGTDEHTITCVLDCRWAYGSEGTIVDLRDPAAPRVAGDWTKALPGGPGQTHDVSEVSPGLVVTSTRTLWMLDARKDPAKPKVVATGRSADGRFIHANLWPRGGKDRLLLVGGETAGAGCSDPSGGAFMTWDASKVAATKKFTMLDSYRAPAKAVPQGGAAAETYCSHWFTPRPGWKDGGEVAVGWYEHGTRLLSVAKTGRIKETGYFVPLGTSASAAYWVTPDILYVVDYQRGLDVLRIHKGKSPRPVAVGAQGLRPDQAPAKKRVFLPAVMSGSEWRCAAPV